MTATRDHLGYLPAAMARMAASPQLLDGFGKLTAIFDRSALDPVAREVVIMTVATRNGCHICVAMHTARLTALGASPDLIAGLRGSGAAAGRAPRRDPGVHPGGPRHRGRRRRPGAAGLPGAAATPPRTRSRSSSGSAPTRCPPWPTGSPARPWTTSWPPSPNISASSEAGGASDTRAGSSVRQRCSIDAAVADNDVPSCRLAGQRQWAGLAGLPGRRDGAAERHIVQHGPR